MKFEIIRAFFVVFGFLQTIANTIYLTKKNGIELAKKQHRELPDTITDKQMKAKTICMFAFGILFFVISLFSYFTQTDDGLIFIIVSGIYMLYSLIEAVYYRFWKTTGAFIISLILLLITLT